MRSLKLTHTHTLSPNTHQLLGQRKIYISSEKPRCLCTRWVCLSLGLTPAAHLIRLVCMCVCLILSVKVRRKLKKKKKYDKMCVYVADISREATVVGRGIVREHTWRRIKDIDPSMLSHRDQGLILINDYSLCLCVKVWAYWCLVLCITPVSSYHLQTWCILRPVFLMKLLSLRVHTKRGFVWEKTFYPEGVLAFNAPTIEHVYLTKKKCLQALRA